MNAPLHIVYAPNLNSYVKRLGECLLLMIERWRGSKLLLPRWWQLKMVGYFGSDFFQMQNLLAPSTWHAECEGGLTYHNPTKGDWVVEDASGSVFEASSSCSTFIVNYLFLYSYKRSWFIYSLIHSIKRNKDSFSRVEKLVVVYGAWSLKYL